jgi:hypothetical protein
MSEYERPSPPTPDELREVIAEAASFAVRFGQGGGITNRTQTLAEARLAAQRLNASSRRKLAVIYAIDATGRSFLVPDSFEEEPRS